MGGGSGVVGDRPYEHEWLRIPLTTFTPLVMELY